MQMETRNFTGEHVVHVFIESRDPWGRKSPLLEADSNKLTMLAECFFKIAFVFCSNHLKNLGFLFVTNIPFPSFAS